MLNQLDNKESIERIATEIKAREIVHLSRFADILNRQLDIVLSKDKVSRLEVAILSLLIVRGGSLTPTQLAKETFRSKHSITRFIASLEKQGFVTRTHARGDLRSVDVEITHDGLVHMENSLGPLDKNWSPVLEALQEEERTVYLKITKKLQKAMLKYISSYRR